MYFSEGWSEGWSPKWNPKWSPKWNPKSKKMEAIIEPKNVKHKNVRISKTQKIDFQNQTP